ncbi:hypothetical protein [Massilia endophytica]|uniref:hypothetical protein n=1 Tax=Massilia endophytica TaxID=2899220 RepID=UPI001E630C0F|nr:hypothetical protein [Massilia endophytica]UGQ48874.1 hypothetical protein LSQ66_10545 [Massilia endophytica]
MRHILSFSIGVTCLSSLAWASEDKRWSEEYKAFTGSYQVYSGSLSEMAPPKPPERKSAFMLKGQAAKELFQSIGPDVKEAEACSSAPHYRERRKGDIDCVHTRENGYTCHFGFDLRTGKSIPGSIC